MDHGESGGCRCILHIDFDAYYAQVESKRLGLSRDVPLAVQQWEGLIAVNYAARARGITRHMRVAEAKKLCPELVMAHVETIGAGGEVHDGGTDGQFLDKRSTQKASLERYRRSTAEVMALLRQLLPGATIEKASIDEVYVDVTGLLDRELRSDGYHQQQVQHQQEQRQQQHQEQQFGDSDAEQDLGAEWHGGSDADAAAQAAAVAAATTAQSGGAATTPAGAAGTASAFAWGAIVMGSSPLDPGSEWDRRLAQAAKIACRVRGELLNKLSYTSSAGISTNKLLAKIGSAMHKPNQMTLIPARSAAEVMRSLPLGKIRGFGGKLGDELESALGCTTAGQVQDVPLAMLQRQFGQERARYIAETVRGVSREPVVEKEAPKSMLAAKSFNTTSDLGALRGWIEILATELADRIANDTLEHRRRPRGLVLTYRGAGGLAEHSKSCPMPRFGPEGPAAAALTDAAFNLLKTRCLPEALPCTRLAVAASDFADLPATGASAITRFLVPRPAASAGPGGGGGRREGSGDAVGVSVEVEQSGADGCMQQQVQAMQRPKQQQQQQGASITSLFERAQKRQRVQGKPQGVGMQATSAKGSPAQGQPGEEITTQAAVPSPPAAQLPAADAEGEAQAAQGQLGTSIDEQQAASAAVREEDFQHNVAHSGLSDQGHVQDHLQRLQQAQDPQAHGQDESLLHGVDVEEQRRILRDIEMRQALDRRQNAKPAGRGAGTKQQRGRGRVHGTRGGANGGPGPAGRGQPGIATFFAKK